jgi:hypothetical protein
MKVVNTFLLNAVSLLKHNAEKRDTVDLVVLITFQEKLSFLGVK